MRKGLLFFGCVMVAISVGCIEPAQPTTTPQPTIPPETPMETVPPTTIQPPENISTKEKYDLWTHHEMLAGAGGWHLLNIPYYDQEQEWSCGQATLRSVLAYYGINKTEKEMYSIMNIGRTDFYDYAHVLREFGLNAYYLTGYDTKHGFEKLDKYVGKYPIVIPVLDDKSKTAGDYHIVMLTGYRDTEQGRQYEDFDPRTGVGSYLANYGIGKDKFLSAWRTGNYKMMVVEDWLWK